MIFFHDTVADLVYDMVENAGFPVFLYVKLLNFRNFSQVFSLSIFHHTNLHCNYLSLNYIIL